MLANYLTTSRYSQHLLFQSDNLGGKYTRGVGERNGLMSSMCLYMDQYQLSV